MKSFRIWTVLSKVQKSLLLTAVYAVILAGNFSTLKADGEYSFRDENYEEIHLPVKPVIQIQKPGSLLNEAPAHTPQITIKSRKEGLEKIRLLQFEFPKEPPTDSSRRDRLMAVYILDKDGLIVGYHAINNAEARFRIPINSVINYVQVYIECYKHGLWFLEFHIRG